MSFKIISCGWECPDFLEWTLFSVEAQSVPDWEIMIIDDASPDPRQAERIKTWCDKRTAMGDHRWHYRINSLNLGTPRNQYEGIKALNPADGDIIVFLDLDGDQLAHPWVLERLRAYYENRKTLLTYGSYRPEPDVGTSQPAQPWPKDIVRMNSYRAACRKGITCFNHLRTMSGKIFKGIPEEQLKWTGTDRWYQHATDYIFMICGLELACGRFTFIPEVLLVYNHANPNADYLIRNSSECVQDFLLKEPLKPMS